MTSDEVAYLTECECPGYLVRGKGRGVGGCQGLAASDAGVEHSGQGQARVVYDEQAVVHAQLHIGACQIQPMLQDDCVPAQDTAL